MTQENTLNTFISGVLSRKYDMYLTVHLMAEHRLSKTLVHMTEVLKHYHW